MYNKKSKLEDEEEFVIVVSCFFWLIVVFVITVSSESYDSTRSSHHLGIKRKATFDLSWQ